MSEPVAETPGPIFAIGGAEAKLRRRSVLRAFVAAAGGPDATIAVVPSASSLGSEIVEVYRAVFGSLGAKTVVEVRPENRAHALNGNLASALDDVTGIFMTGGNQLKLSNFVCGTPFGDAILAAHRRGVVVGGTSAGASILADHMIAFGSGGTTPKQRMSQLSAGLGLLTGVVIDQHFEQRNRYGRLLSLVAQSPSLLGIGIDEDTAAVVRDARRLEVVGRGSVTVIDGQRVVSNAFEAQRTGPAARLRCRSARAAGRQPVRPSKPGAHHPPRAAARHRGGGGAGRGGRPAPARPGDRGRGRLAELVRPPAATRTALSPTGRRSGPLAGSGGRMGGSAQADRRGVPGVRQCPSRSRRRAGTGRRADPGVRRPTRPDLKILSERVFRGPNVWHYEPAIQLVVDLGMLEDFPTNLIPGFADALVARLPGLENHSCSRGKRGGLVERLHEGTWLGHVAEHVALQLQQAVGHDMRRGKTRQVRGERGRYNVIYAYSDEGVGLAAGHLAVKLVNDLIEHDPDFDFDAELESFIVRGERTAFGPSTQAIVDEAVSRDIPFIRLNTSSLVQLGQGVHQKRIRATMTSNTSSVAVDIASNKELTLNLLSAAGLPVPRSQSVRRAEDAVRLANRIGYPVVVKPLDGNHGRGVILDLQSDDAVRKAFDIAYEESRNGWIIVETYITGKDYRCLVIDGRIAAIAERVPAHVIGDGSATISELVERTNADPRRGVGHEKVLTRIKVDDAAIELVREQG